MFFSSIVYLININDYSTLSIYHRLMDRLQLQVMIEILYLKFFFYNKLLCLECTNDTYKAVLERNTDLERENERIQRLNTTLQSRVYDVSLRVCEQKSSCIHDQKNNFCFSLRI